MDEQETQSNAALDLVREEVKEIMTNKDHPMHEGYWRKDKAVMAHIDAQYKRAVGTGTVEL